MFQVIFLGSWWNVLLPFVILAILAYFLRWGDTAAFIFCIISVAPLAERLCFVTEQLALGTTESIGGLLNASFGNLPEVLFVSLAVQSDHHLTRMLLLGSVVGNLLLVLGLSLVFGGVRFKEQRFSSAGTATSLTVLLVGAVAIAILSVISSATPDTVPGQPSELEVNLSRVASIILVVFYLSFLYYQLFSHPHLFEESNDDSDDKEEGDEQKGEPEKEEPELGTLASLLWLAAITVPIAMISHIIVETINHAAAGLSLPIAFMSMVVVPLAGNATDHACAIMFAYQNELAVTFGICVGSSMQILMFVAPYTVIYAWAVGSQFSLGFTMFEALALLGSVMVVSQALQSGRSDWMTGAVIILMFSVIVAGTLYV